MNLQGANVVLGVTGGIACYKAIDLASKLVQAGAVVDVIMTTAATEFVSPLPFQTITGRPVSVDMFKLLDTMDMAHISLSKKADAVVIAPATANTMARLAQGLADSLLSSTVLATRAPLVLAPAMDADMWANSATQANVATLVRQGAMVVGPDAGRLASGRMGVGRLTTTSCILGAVAAALGRHGALAGRRLLVTAGGTREPLDPVRFLGNRSSGKMGYALAEAARNAGATVTLVSAPTALDAPWGVEMVQVGTAAEMARAVLDHSGTMDALIMAAAVADYCPAEVAQHKLKKDDVALGLTFARTADILAAVAERRSTGAPSPTVVVGFAAETQDLIANARAKIGKKCLDLIVANDISAADSGFGVDTNRVVLIDRHGRSQALPLMSKADVAWHVVDRVAGILR